MACVDQQFDTDAPEQAFILRHEPREKTRWMGVFDRHQIADSDTDLAAVDHERKPAVSIVIRTHSK
ncbi:hypothetical protein U5801_03910 [Lamprobacter modestohalophilus]|uniref:hypothetical protein n=1 Tax=Lamprobacter modestohalophilus TaxID=1064514 RepID=UPI002ADEF5C8|nr:hypothetical protein [Lamprobacter modestohalophilus]MEA1048958.1 hypothetical protein [Lamprobacter modestohalophilus]